MSTHEIRITCPVCGERLWECYSCDHRWCPACAEQYTDADWAQCPECREYQEVDEENRDGDT